MSLTVAHWFYLASVVAVLAVTIARRNVLVPALLATAVTAWIMTGSGLTAIQSVFNASLTAASELFTVFLIIALVTAMLGALRAMRADRRMVTPFRRFMRGGWSSYVVLAVVSYALSLFFWPTPAAALLGAILVPAAIRVGLPPIAAAMAIAITGQGMALSSDYVIQAAPGMSAAAAGVEVSAVADVALVLSLVTGGVALTICGFAVRKEMRRPSAALLEDWENGVVGPSSPTRRSRSRSGVLAPRGARATPDAPEPAAAEPTGVPVRTGGAEAVAVAPNPAPGATAEPGGGHAASSDREGGATGLRPPVAAPVEDARVARLSRVFAVAVPGVFALLLLYMALGKFTTLVPPVVGGAGSGLVGGVAALLVVAATVALDGPGKALQTTGEHLVDGLVFAFKAMGAVLPIAGFFMLGNAETAARILGLEEGRQAPGLMVELVTSAQAYLPDNPVVLSFAVLLIGLGTGLDGSGFGELPLTGALSGALGPAVGMDPAVLAAVGQMGAIWAGGGVLVAWSSVIVVAGVTRTDVVELTRRCLVPVLTGLAVATVIAALLL